MKPCASHLAGQASVLPSQRYLARRPVGLGPDRFRQGACRPSTPCRPCAAAKQATERRGRKKAAKEEQGSAQNGGGEEGGAEQRAGGRQRGGSAAPEEDAAAANPDAELNEALSKLLETHSVDEIMEQMHAEGLVPEETIEDFPLNAGREPGYTPFEYIQFTEEEISHNLTIQVAAPLAKVYRIWANRINYNEWFDLIGQVILHTEDPDYASYFLFYRWGKLPTLELYSTLLRTAVENESILEQSVDGMNLAAAAYFTEKDGGTEVVLRVAYHLPEPLREFVGPVGVWGDVNDILQENLANMKAFVEGVDIGELEAARAEDQARMDAELAQQNEDLAQINRELDEEGVAPGEGSPAARAEMARLRKELGIEVEADRMEEEEEPDQAEAFDDSGYDADEADEDADAPSGLGDAAREPAPSRSGRPLASVALRELVDLAAAGKTQAEAARALGMTRNTLIRHCKDSGFKWTWLVGGGWREVRARLAEEEEQHAEEGEQHAEPSGMDSGAEDSDGDEPGRGNVQRLSTKGEDLSREQIQGLIDSGNSQRDVVRILGVTLNTLRKRSKDLGIQWPAKPRRQAAGAKK